MSEHRTGYYDKGHRIRLPYIKLARWQDLTPGNNLSWGEWGVHPLQSWHHNLADRWIVAGSRVTYRSDIIDHGSSEVIAPIIDITTEVEGQPGVSITLDSSNEDVPTVLIEGSDNADMSSASEFTFTRTSNPTYTPMAAKRYYRVTVQINAGTMFYAMNGLKSVNIVLNNPAADTSGYVVSGIKATAMNFITGNIGPIE